MFKNPSQALPKPSPNPPKIRPNPPKIHPMSSPEASKSTFEDHSKYKHQKMTLKSGPRGAKKLQPPPKTLPKPSPNLPKIDRKTNFKTTSFLEAFFPQLFRNLASKSINFGMDCRCVPPSKFYRFLGPFRVPNPLLFDPLAIPCSIERENRGFYENMHFPLGKIIIF